MTKFTRKVTVAVEIGGNELIDFLIWALMPDAKSSEGQERTFFIAFVNLPGHTDVETVRIANVEADKQGLPHIKTDEFRRWLPQVLSEVFAEFLKGD